MYKGRQKHYYFLLEVQFHVVRKNMLICCKVLQEFSSQRNGSIKCILTRRSIRRETFIFIKSLNLLSSVPFFLQSADSIKGKAVELALSHERPLHLCKEEVCSSFPLIIGFPLKTNKFKPRHTNGCSVTSLQNK